MYATHLHRRHLRSAALVLSALALARAAGVASGNEQLWRQLNASGWEELDRQQYHPAADLFDQAIAFARKLSPADHRLGYSLVGRAAVYAHHGDYDQALRLATEAFPLVHAAPKSDGHKQRRLAINYHLLGISYIRMRDFQRAHANLEHAEHAYELARAEPAVRAQVLLDLARLEASRLQFGLALDRISAANALAKDGLQRLAVVTDYSDVLTMLGRLEQARHVFELFRPTLAELAARKPPPPGIFSAYIAFGHLAYVRGDLCVTDQLLTHAKQCLTRDPHLDNEAAIRLWLTSARLHLARDEFDAALEQLEQIKSVGYLADWIIAEKNEIEGWIFVRRGRYYDATCRFAEALAIKERVYSCEHPDLCEPLLGLATALFWRGNPGSHLQAHLLRVLSIRKSIAGETDLHPHSARAQTLLAEYFAGRMQYAVAQSLNASARELLTASGVAEWHPALIAAQIGQADIDWARDPNNLSQARQVIDSVLARLQESCSCGHHGHHCGPGKHHLVAEAETVRGWLDLSCGQPESGEQHFCAAISVYESHRNLPARAEAKLGLALSYLEQHRPRTAVLLWMHGQPPGDYSAEQLYLLRLERDCLGFELWRLGAALDAYHRQESFCLLLTRARDNYVAAGAKDPNFAGYARHIKQILDARCQPAYEQIPAGHHSETYPRPAYE